MIQECPKPSISSVSKHDINFVKCVDSKAKFI